MHLIPFQGTRLPQLGQPYPVSHTSRMHGTKISSMPPETKGRGGPILIQVPAAARIAIRFSSLAETLPDGPTPDAEVCVSALANSVQLLRPRPVDFLNVDGVRCV